ncbi:U7 snRNA-associated Sm-like protein LSm11 [Frankliniella fusca]|uniref:U7 snRNA-associated Sm-like protein LSm11 n=1 Tax=Frankliniella fusca TaxID=407009 RepID=A0AAE1HY89_9NEOP|nr:U7 snRNA-associated Sm-like protein LSm11 [Frankliniella fusca]
MYSHFAISIFEKKNYEKNSYTILDFRFHLLPQVVTRDAQGVHGRLEGYVVLFDKHWNLAMSDVTEVFYRSTPRRAKDYFPADAGVREVTNNLSELCVSQALPPGAGRGRGRGRGRGLVGAGPTCRLPRPADLVPEQELREGRGKGRGKRSREEMADWIPLPKLFYRPCGKRQECVRHIGQLFVRGEHVVFVQILSAGAV